MWIFIASALSACTPASAPGAPYDLHGDGQASALVTAPAGGGGLGSAWVVGTGALIPLNMDGGIQDIHWAGDVDADGRWELLVLSGETLHLARVQDGALELLGPKAPGSHGVQGDVNGDGRADQLFLGAGGLMLALSGELDRAVPIDAPGGLMDMAVGDLDGDGRADWVGLELQQGPTGVQAVALARPGQRGGLGDVVDHPLPAGQVPAWMRILSWDGQTRLVFGMPDGPKAFSFQGGKLRPEPTTGLPSVPTRDLRMWEGQPLSWRGDGVYRGEQRLEGPQPDSGIVLRDLQGDGRERLVWASRSQAQVGVLEAGGRVTTISSPAEASPFPPGRLLIGEGGEVYVQWKDRLFSQGGEISWEEAPVGPLDATAHPRHLETEWGSLDWEPTGEVTWTDTAGQTREVLQGVGGAVDIAVRGEQGVALGVSGGSLAWFRFELGPQGPGLAKVQPPPAGGLSFFGASLR